ncbi:MAG TPA: SBBP repeat-containing protein, partial [bacterium]
MNLKKSLSLISIGLFLPIFIAPLVQGQVTIELTPITYPIVLPDSGGSFDYLLTVTNQGSAITATVWCMVTLPNGSSWGPVVGPATRTLAAGQTQSYYRSQIIPQRAPCGYYLMRAYVGIYPDTIWAQDQFEFQHQAVRGTEQEWVARYNGPANSGDEAHSITLDNDGNIYVTGWGINSGIHSDYATVKYDANGNQIWAALYNGPANNEDKACALAVDGSRNVYVTGYSYGRGSNYDYVTVKYDSSGNQIWVARFNGPANGEDKAIALAVDGGGHVYVTGRSLGIGTFEDYTTIQYDASGNQIWVACYGHSGWDAAYALEVDGTGNIYVTGSSNGGATFLDYATVKYDASGNQIWVARYNGPGNYSDDYAFALAVDGVGNVYVTGESPGRGTDYDYAT